MSSQIILDSMKEVLGQGEALLMALDDVAYATKIPAAFNASVGAHYRHCLDHFRSVFDGLDAAEVNYDNRKRDPRIEAVREVALTHTRELLRASEGLGDWILDYPIHARSKVSYVIDESPSALSTVAREIMFCVVHAIHHYALIRVMCGMLNAPVPGGFGVAPSTIKHQESVASVRDRHANSRDAQRAPLQELDKAA
jgi:hypothetical protein